MRAVIVYNVRSHQSWASVVCHDDCCGTPEFMAWLVHSPQPFAFLVTSKIQSGLETEALLIPLNIA